MTAGWLSFGVALYLSLIGTSFATGERRARWHRAEVLSLSTIPLWSSEEGSSNFSPELQPKSDLPVHYPQNFNQSFYEPHSEFDNRTDFCPSLSQHEADVDSTKVFPSLGFLDSWTRGRWFWKARDFDFEGRYIKQFKSGFVQPIRVFVIPHSHSDPGWLKTFEGYFYARTKNTLDLAVQKLTLYPNMTFVWNEISFLSKWWNQARNPQKIQLLRLIEEGRLEILTGGWVMADEATVTLYGLIDELIEGRQWALTRLGVIPKVSWSIDPFGHGSTMPYLLKKSGINRMVIQRLHYSWKKYLAQNESGNFFWVQRWDAKGRADSDILCHNAPYDLYTTKHTCGPDPQVCLKFDFRNIEGEFSAYTPYNTPVWESDLNQLSEELVGQFRRTASLGPSSVVMFPLGDDFRYDKAQEWDQQYENYALLMNYINSNYHRFRVQISFGTVSDYFQALESENLSLPSFSGDFFPYSDVYSSGRPSYWTGYYGTRPYWKKFYRELENNMRSAEILYTYAYNLAHDDPIYSVILRREYVNLITARRNFALFAHHDGATGTSRRGTMDDYGRKLLDASRTALNIQRQSLLAVLKNGLNLTRLSSLSIESQVLKFGELPTQVRRVIYETEGIVKKIVMFNSLSFKRSELVKIRVTNPYVKVYGPNNKLIASQINPVFENVENNLWLSNMYELVFKADLLPWTIHFFEIRKSHPRDPEVATVSKLSCRGCIPETLLNDTQTRKMTQFFQTEGIQDPTLIIGNGEEELYFNGISGYLERVILLRDKVSLPVRLSFGGYKSVFRESGAYLLKPETSTVFQVPYNAGGAKLVLVEGPVMSYLTSYNPPITTTTTLLQESGHGIKVQNLVDLQDVALEVYMRFDTWLNSTTKSPEDEDQRQPTMYTDQSGYTVERRVKVPIIGYEGNTYPVNTMAYLQDAENGVRFTVGVDRAHGFTSMHVGQLETLIERRTLYDDGRGMSEGVTDNKKTISNYILNVERLPEGLYNPNDLGDYANNLPSLTTQKMVLALNNPSNVFGYDEKAGGYLGSHSLLTEKIPDDTHIINMRTVGNLTLPLEDEVPLNEALMVVQKLGYLNGSSYECVRPAGFSSSLFYDATRFSGLSLLSTRLVDLSGIYTLEQSLQAKLPSVLKQAFEITSLKLKFYHRNLGRRRRIL